MEMGGEVIKYDADLALKVMAFGMDRAEIFRNSLPLSDKHVSDLVNNPGTFEYNGFQSNEKDYVLKNFPKCEDENEFFTKVKDMFCVELPQKLRGEKAKDVQTEREIIFNYYMVSVKGDYQELGRIPFLLG